MGDVERTVEILFQGRDDTRSAITSIQNSLDSLETTANDIGGGLEDLGAPFQAAAESVAVLELAILGIAAAGLTARENIESEANKMSDALGLPSEAAEEFEEVAKRVYSSGFGGDLEESFSAVTIAAQKFSEETAGGIEEIVTNANKINAVFGADVSESLAAANTLMSNFGLTSKEAFDFIVAGYQEGITGRGDFLESINEYSTQFSNAGADAAEFFSVLQTGYQEGLLGTDKAADAFKEFRVRIQDGSKTTQEALEQIGLGDNFVDSITNGEITATEAFNTVIQKLNETDDSTVVMQAGVGLIGTQFEDLGTTAALALSTTETSLDDLAGKIDSIDPAENLGVKFEAMMKTITTTLVSDDAWGGVETSLGEIFDGFKDNFVEAWGNIDDSDLQPLLDSFEDLFGSIQDLFADAGFDLSSVEGIEEAIQKVIDSVTSINNISTGFIDAIAPITTAISELIDLFNDLDPETQELAGKILAVGTALGGIGTALAAGGAILGGLSTLASSMASGGALYAAATGLVAILTGPAGLAVAFGAAGAAALAYADSKINGDIEAQTAALQAQNDELEKIIDSLEDLPLDAQTIEIDTAIETGDYEEAKRLIEEALEEERELKIKAQMEQQEFDDFWSDLVDLGEIDPAQIEILANTESFDEASDKVDDFVAGKEAEVKLNVETEHATETLTYWTEENGTVEVEVPVTTSGADEAKKAIEDIPTEKQIEITLQGDIDKEIAQIEASAQTAEAAFKYTAEVDISQIEADAEVATAAFESIGESVSSMSSSVEGMFGSLTSAFSDENLTQLQKWNLEDIVEEQQDAQNKLIDSQVALNDAQVEYMNLKMESMQGGEALIKIDSTGLEPALEMVLWEILEKVQIRASEEAADFLLGVS